MDFNSCYTCGIGGYLSKWNKSSKDFVVHSRDWVTSLNLQDVFFMKPDKLERPMVRSSPFLNDLKKGKPDYNIITNI